MSLRKGRSSDVLTRAHLELLYQTEIEEVAGGPGQGRAFLPR